MGLRKLLIEFQRLYGRGLAPGIRVPGWEKSPRAEERIAIAKSGVGERVARIFVDGVLEQFDCAAKALLRPFVPVVPPFQVRLIRVRVLRGPFRQRFSLLAAQFG